MHHLWNLGGGEASVANRYGKSSDPGGSWGREDIYESDEVGALRRIVYVMELICRRRGSSKFAPAVDVDPKGRQGNLMPTPAHQAQCNSIHLQSLVSRYAKVVVTTDGADNKKRVGIVEDEVVVQCPEDHLLPYLHWSSLHGRLLGHWGLRSARTCGPDQLNLIRQDVQIS